MFVSTRGFESLCDIRIGTPPSPTGSAPVRMIAALPSEECGCPEELWIVNTFEVLIHFEASGASEMFVYTGDYEIEKSFEGCRNMNDLRAKMFQFFADNEGVS